jgi:hypothetical protein
MLIHRLIIDGPKQAIYLPKQALAQARKAGHVVETRDVYGYAVVAASAAGCTAAVSPALRTEELALWLLGSTVRKVLHTGESWPTVDEVPSRLRGHVRNWLLWAYDPNGTATPSRTNGRQYCIDQGWIVSLPPDYYLTPAGWNAAIALGVIPETPYYEVGGADSRVRYKLTELPLPVPDAPQGPDPRASLVARVAELESRVAVLEGRGEATCKALARLSQKSGHYVKVPT